VREEDTGGREAGAPLDLKLQLENGRANERVSRGQASESSRVLARTPPMHATRHNSQGIGVGGLFLLLQYLLQSCSRVGGARL
jgi:hypothetical protein